MNPPDPAVLYHEQTKHGPQPRDRSHILEGFKPMDPANRPQPFKRYAAIEPLPLPDDFTDSDVSAVDVLSGTATPAKRPLDARELARLLYFAAGVTRSAHGYFRAAQSAGNLHPVEVYVACRGLPGLDAGLYHFAPLELGLHPLRAEEARVQPSAPVWLVLTGIPWRTSWKYTERGLRHVWWDAGSMLANVLAIAGASGWDARVHCGFADDDVSRLLGIDGTTEFPVAIVTLEGGEPNRVDVSPLAELDARAEPISPRPVEFPLITRTQLAGRLDDDAIETWRKGARPAAAAAASPPSPSSGPIEQTILRRGSTRIMRHERVRAEAYEWALAAATRPAPTDFGTLLDHYVAVHAVDGMRPGLYRFGPGEPIVAGEEDQVRATSRHLCLDQPLGGDSAYTVYHCADLDHVLGTFGGRGYRCAQLEAGLVSGRLHLAAFALGLGATGLTFYDDEVSEAFRTPAACMLVTSVGVPAYRSRPGGRPRAPTELQGFGRLMDRMMESFQKKR